MSNYPKVSIILPLYNSEKFIADTIKSILSQTFQNFELLIINDGSTDNSMLIVAEFDDSRLRIIDKVTNSGIVDTLNIGISEAKGNFIARIDADDIALTKRLQTQVNYLIQNPEIGVVGTAIQHFGHDSENVFFQSSYDLLKTGLVFNNQICHPTVMINRTIIAKEDLIYKNDFHLTEDWALWFELSIKGYKMTNLPETLLNYRMEGQNITVNNKETEKNRHLKIYEYILKTLDLDYSSKNVNLHCDIARAEVGIKDLKKIRVYFNILSNKLKEGNYPAFAVNTILNKKKEDIFYAICSTSSIQALKFLILNRLFSIKKLKYLLSIRFKPKN